MILGVGEGGLPCTAACRHLKIQQLVYEDTNKARDQATKAQFFGSSSLVFCLGEHLPIVLSKDISTVQISTTLILTRQGTESLNFFHHAPLFNDGHLCSILVFKCLFLGTD